MRGRMGKRAPGIGRAVVAVAAVILMVAGLPAGFFGILFGPALLLVRPGAPGPAWYRLILLDLAATGVLVVLGSSLAAARKRRARQTGAKRAGQGVLILGILVVVIGFQEAVINVDVGNEWLGDMSLAIPGILIFWTGLRIINAAARQATFPESGSADAAVPWPRRIRGWAFRVTAWPAWLTGAAVLVFGVVTAATTLISPAPSGLITYAVVLVQLTVAGLGSAIFRLGPLARDAGRRCFGLATPLRDRARSALRNRILVPMMLVAGAAMASCGFRLALRDLTRLTSSGPHGLPGYALALINVAIAAAGVVLCRSGVACQRATGRGDNAALLPRRRSARGWLLRVTGWLMRAVGGSIMLVSVIAMPTSINWSHEPDYQGLPWYVLVLFCITANGVGFVVLKFGAVPAMRANRYLANVLTSPSALSPGSYVLYLRPFFQDTNSAAHIARGRHQNSWTKPINSMLESNRSHEERLGAMFAEFGPLLTLGSPGEPVPGGAGAHRLYLPLDGWQETVAELIDNARLIVLGTGPGPGTVWEYVEVLRRRPPSRLVLLVTDPVDYQRFKASSIAEAEGVLFELKQRYGDRWEAPILPELEHYQQGSADTSFWFRAVVYFTDYWEPHLISLTTSAVTGNFALDNEKLKNRIHPMIAHLRGPAAARKQHI